MKTEWANSQVALAVPRSKRNPHCSSWTRDSINSFGSAWLIWIPVSCCSCSLSWSLQRDECVMWINGPCDDARRCGGCEVLLIWPTSLSEGKRIIKRIFKYPCTISIQMECLLRYERGNSHCPSLNGGRGGQGGQGGQGQRAHRCRRLFAPQSDP